MTREDLIRELSLLLWNPVSNDFWEQEAEMKRIVNGYFEDNPDD